MPYKPPSDPAVAGAMEREAPLHARYKEVEPDLASDPGSETRVSLLPGHEGIPPDLPGRGDAAKEEAVSLVSATRPRQNDTLNTQPFEPCGVLVRERKKRKSGQGQRPHTNRPRLGRIPPGLVRLRGLSSRFKDDFHHSGVADSVAATHFISSGWADGTLDPPAGDF